MVQYLAKGIDVRLNTKVVKVDASRADRITLTTAAGGTFTARRVIVTVPLGVLQHKVITFVPPLPAVNQKAINTLGMGLLNKLTLVFPRVFWTDDAKVEVINRVAPLGDGVLDEQQRVADRFHKLGLIPNRIAVRDIVWKWEPRA